MNLCRPLLGTYVEIRADYPNEAWVIGAMNAAFNAIQSIHDLMSFHSEKSDIFRINTQAYLEPIVIHDWTYAVLEKALDIFDKSEGLFDCGISHTLIKFGLLPDSNKFMMNANSSIKYLKLRENNTIYLEEPSLIDLGGIAKGFAVDQAAHVLQCLGIKNAVINAGGDMLIMGNIEEKIHVRSPINPKHLHYLGSLKEGAIATSGSYFSNILANSPDGSALINPATREAIVNQHSYSVIAKNCIEADALTKVLAISHNPKLACFDYYSAYPIII